MSKRIQAHLLKTVAPSNLNRDELGRPKTTIFGGTQRLRISSQCLKRSVRTSETFQSRFEGLLLTQTRDLGVIAFNKYVGQYDQGTLVDAITTCNIILEKGVKDKEVKDPASKDYQKALKKGRDAFKDIETSANTLQTGQIMKLHDFQVRGYDKAVEHLCLNGVPKTIDDTDIIARMIHGSESDQHAVDIALFGRMMTSNKEQSFDAAVQFAHAIGVDELLVDSDYFTAVDDLSDQGSGHIGNKEFGSSTMYMYVCIDYDLLVRNLKGDTELATRAINALLGVLSTVNPSGSQSGFASQTWADYMKVEISKGQPLQLTTAFEKPIVPKRNASVMSCAIEALEETYTAYQQTFGVVSKSASYNRLKSEGTLPQILEFVQSELQG